MRLLFSFLLLVGLSMAGTSKAQLLQQKQTYSRADTLRGMLTPLRTCYDIHFYHLDVQIDIANKSVAGSNEFVFTATQDFTELQFDLFENMIVDKVLYKEIPLPFTREFGAVFVTFPETIKKGSKEQFTVYYHGQPRIAKTPPWDGGFIFKKDKSGHPFVSVACQGLGASVWWPNKDHQSDKVDSMLISIAVPKDLDEISNGRLRQIEDLKNGYRRHSWFVGSPINNYNVTFYIGKYAHWTDVYQGEKGPLTLDYWALKEDSAVARPHWDADVKRMMHSFEHWFGPFPWYNDGFKLVQAPHLGMEHQSAVAYGNQFKKGYLGMDMSGTGHGLDWDYITIHETGHEWFANNITTKDIADMWIHEGFTTYSEALFTESTQGKTAGQKYVIGLRKDIQNRNPIIGPYHVNKEGDPDMYPKGANIVHTLRQLIGNDEKFRQILRGMNAHFSGYTTSSEEIEAYIRHKSGLKLRPFFDQYLRHASLPVLEYKTEKKGISYRWKTEVTDFQMTVKVSLESGKELMLKANNKWKLLRTKEQNLHVDPNYYVMVRKIPST